ncbi:hypothetical protein [Sphingomonas folli]|uniref:hypothetical protein n=1 Tax=Sphingomonas folli TaxID=2862497 RepID=UPI001CA5D1E2|nr:hypothetical protein [Sphingomonas folli]
MTLVALGSGVTDTLAHLDFPRDRRAHAALDRSDERARAPRAAAATGSPAAVDHLRAMQPSMACLGAARRRTG